MPIYEYRCPKCSAEFEELVFGRDTPPCPRCGADDSERLLSRPCLHLPAPSRVGQTMTYPSGGKSACAGCSGGSCATCR